MKHEINQLDTLTDALVGDVVRHFGSDAVKSVEQKMGQPLTQLFRETLVSESAFPTSPHNYDTTFMLAHLHETAGLNGLSYTVGYNGKTGQFKTTIEESEGEKIVTTRDTLAEAVSHAHRLRNLMKASDQGIFDDN
jgi:hypothetical protein